MDRTPGDRPTGARATRDRVALVTGASSGIGRAAADQLAARGWTVVGASRSATAGSRWQAIPMDVDDNASVAAGVAEVLDRHGRLDALVAAAGWGLAGPVETTPLDQARAQLETVFWGSVRATTAVLPPLRASGGGRVVLVSSIAGEIAIPFQAYYSAAKFALEGWAEALAYEVAPYGIHVTLVQPGNFRTGFTDARRRAADAGPYADAAAHAVSVMERDERAGADPAAAAACIVGQLEARRPRRRVSVGRAGERVGLVAKRVLPHRAFEVVAKDSLGVR